MLTQMAKLMQKLKRNWVFYMLLDVNHPINILVPTLVGFDQHVQNMLKPFYIEKDEVIAKQQVELDHKDRIIQQIGSLVNTNNTFTLFK